MEVFLTPGDHTIELKLTGYSTLTMTVNVNSEWVVTCKSVAGGVCGSSAPPGVIISGRTITGYLKAIPVTNYDEWVSSKGGATALKGNTSAYLEIIDGYLGIVNVGFTVNIGNVLKTIDYYLGLG